MLVAILVLSIISVLSSFWIFLMAVSIYSKTEEIIEKQETKGDALSEFMRGLSEGIAKHASSEKKGGK